MTLVGIAQSQPQLTHKGMRSPRQVRRASTEKISTRLLASAQDRGDRRREELVDQAGVAGHRAGRGGSLRTAYDLPNLRKSLRLAVRVLLFSDKRVFYAPKSVKGHWRQQVLALTLQREHPIPFDGAEG